MKISRLCMGFLLSASGGNLMAAPWIRDKVNDFWKQRRLAQERATVYVVAPARNNSSPNADPVACVSHHPTLTRKPTHVKGRTAVSVVDMLGELNANVQTSTTPPIALDSSAVVVTVASSAVPLYPKLSWGKRLVLALTCRSK